MQRTTEAVCEYCGSQLLPHEIPLDNGAVLTIGYEQCSCSAATAAAERAEAERVRKEAEEQNMRRLQRLKNAGVRPRYINAQHPQAEAVLAACRRRANVYIHGDVGAGKTTLLSAAAIAMVDSPKFKRIILATSVEVLDAIKATFNGRNYDDPLLPYKQASVLLLDDLGKEAPTDWVLEKLFDLINERYNELLPTVITTQFTPEKLVERRGKNGAEENAVAIVSRLRSQADAALLIHMQGEDRRMCAAASSFG